MDAGDAAQSVDATHPTSADASYDTGLISDAGIDAAMPDAALYGASCTNPSPTITNVTPSFVPCVNNTAFTIDGTGFLPTSKVYFVDGAPTAAKSVQYVSPTELVAVLGSAGPAATIAVVVFNPDDCGATWGSIKTFCEK